MKTRLLSLFTVVLLLVTSSCEKFKQLDDVTFEVVLLKSFNIDENFNGTNIPYTDVQTLDAKSHADIEKYQDKIESFTVTKVTYTIKSFSSGDGTTVNFTNGSMSFSALSQTTPSVIASVASVDLMAASLSGQEFTLPVNTAGLEEIADFLKNDLSVKIYSSGTFSKAPVAFTVEARMYATVVASALN